MAKGGGNPPAAKPPAARRPPPSGPRRERRKVRQNLGREWCWATVYSAKEGCWVPCKCRATAKHNGNLPYCDRHLAKGDPALKVVEHPTRPDIGKILVAARDLPRGYKMLYWGTRSRWRGCKGEDRAMSYLSGGGVITPWGHAGQQLQYMSCPGPSEKCNTKSTDECFGDTYDKHLVGREFETSQPVPKHTQLIQWYGSKDWFEARNIVRQDCGTEQYPAPLRKQPVRKPKPAGAAPRRALGEKTNL